MNEFKHVTVTKKANVYFDGQVTSRKVTFADGSIKTLGIMMVGEYEFSTNQKELMEITAGKVSVKLPNDDKWQDYNEGQQFNVPANASFSIKVLSLTDYCCSYFD